MTGIMFEASYYSVLSQTCQPSDTNMLHGHGLNTENAFLNVCEEYEILNQSMRPSAFYQSADSEVVCASSSGCASHLQFSVFSVWAVKTTALSTFHI